MFCKRETLETLPPTKSATTYHSFRIFFKKMQWKEMDNLHATDWSWAVKSNQFTPMLTDLQVAT